MNTKIKKFVAILTIIIMSIILIIVVSNSENEPTTADKIDANETIWISHETPWVLENTYEYNYSEIIQSTLEITTTELSSVVVQLETLPPIEAQDIIQEMMHNTNSCSLPCMLGISPGETTIVDVRKFIEHFDIQYFEKEETINGNTILTIKPKIGQKLGLDGDFTNHYFEIIVQDELVDSITIRVMQINKYEDYQLLWSSYKLEQVFADYGVPTRIYLTASGVSGLGDSGSIRYGFWIIYDNLGFGIYYDGVVINSPIFHFCPTFDNSGSQIGLIEVYSQSVRNQKSLNEGLPLLDDKDFADGSIKPIFDASGISVDEFYQLFINSEGLVCFDSPQNIWPAK